MCASNSAIPVLQYSHHMARTRKRSTCSPAPQTCNCCALTRSARKRSRRAECGGATTGFCRRRRKRRVLTAQSWRWERRASGDERRFHEGDSSPFAFPRFVCSVRCNISFSFLVKRLACGAPPQPNTTSNLLYCLVVAASAWFHPFESAGLTERVM